MNLPRQISLGGDSSVFLSFLFFFFFFNQTKAVQAKVDVKNTSTMVQVDPQTCDVSVQVQDPTMAKDRSRMDDDDAREIDEDLRETNEISKGKKKVTEAIGEKSNKRMVKENKPRIDKHKSNEKGKKAKGCKGVNEGKEKENVAKAEFAGKKRKVSRKRKASQREDVASQSETTTPAEEQQTTTQVEKRQSSTLAEKQDEFHERANASKIWFIAPSASQEDDIPFQYSKTPGRLQKLEESGQSLEKHGDKSDASTQGPQDGTTASMEKTSPSNERCKVALKDLTPLAVFVEDIANKDFVLESKGEGKEPELKKDFSRARKDSFAKKPSQEQSMESEHVVSEEQKRVSIEKDKDLLGLNEARIQLQDEKESLGDSERTNACKDQNVNEKKRKTSKGKKEKEKKQKTRQVKSTEENISQDEGKIEEKGTDEANETPAGRVLRSRAKERNFGVEMNPCRGEERKILGTETRQKPQDFDVGSMVTKKCKTDVEYLEGREPAMLDKSSPKADQLPQETNMSSHEIDRHVDGPRPSRGVTSRKPADDTTQQPEAEVVRGLNEGNKSAQGELLLKDYKSDQGSLGLNDNRIKKVEETIVHGCLHKALQEGKSPRSDDCQKAPDPNEKNNNTLNLSSKNKKIKRAGQQLQDVDDVSAAKKQDLDSTEPVLTRQTAKSTSRDTGRSKRNGKNPAAVPAFEKTATASKENAPDGKTGRNKR